VEPEWELDDHRASLFVDRNKNLATVLEIASAQCLVLEPTIKNNRGFQITISPPEMWLKHWEEWKVTIDF
jgi:hypothetical protein